MDAASEAVHTKEGALVLLSRVVADTVEFRAVL
jgi:hypothetical protein